MLINKIRLISVILMLSLLITACGGKDVSNGSSNGGDNGVGGKTVKEINISYVKLPLNVPSIVEKKNQLFEKEFEKDGIKVSFPEITEGSKMTEAVAAGSLDFCNALGGTSAILAAANGVDVRIIGIYSRAPKAFTLMALDPEINSIENLRGKKIVGPKGTILHQLLLAVLNDAGIKLDEVEYINMSIPEGVSAMMAGKADVALVAGPTVIQALNSGARVLTTGEGYLDATIVIGVRGEFMDKYPDLVKRYMDVHLRSLEFMKENPEETYQMASEETGLTVDEVKMIYDWYDFNPEIREEDIVELEKTQDFLVENEMLENKINIRDMIYEIPR